MPRKKQPLVPAPTVGRYKNHRYMNPDGTVNGEKLLGIVRSMPGGFALMLLNAMIEEGAIDEKYQNKAREIIEALCHILIPLAAFGDEESDTQLTAILKLVHPTRYEVPKNN